MDNTDMPADTENEAYEMPPEVNFFSSFFFSFFFDIS